MRAKHFGDLYEGIYDYLVVEKISEEIHSAAEDEILFRWADLIGSHRDSGSWEEIPKPPAMANDKALMEGDKKAAESHDSTGILSSRFGGRGRRRLTRPDIS